MKKEFSLKRHLFSSLNLDDIRRKCNTYASALLVIGGSEPGTYAVAVAKLPPK